MSGYDIRRLTALLEGQGWSVGKTGRSHYKFTPPDGGLPITHSFTPSDRRGIQNCIAELRRRGLRVPGYDNDRDRKSEETMNTRPPSDPPPAAASAPPATTSASISGLVCARCEVEDTDLGRNPLHPDQPLGWRSVDELLPNKRAAYGVSAICRMHQQRIINAHRPQVAITKARKRAARLLADGGVSVGEQTNLTPPPPASQATDEREEMLEMLAALETSVNARIEALTQRLDTMQRRLDAVIGDVQRRTPPGPAQATVALSQIRAIASLDDEVADRATRARIVLHMVEEARD